jgi:hypothetical protein
MDRGTFFLIFAIIALLMLSSCQEKCRVAKREGFSNGIKDRISQESVQRLARRRTNLRRQVQRRPNRVIFQRRLAFVEELMRVHQDIETDSIMTLTRLADGGYADIELNHFMIIWNDTSDFRMSEYTKDSVQGLQEMARLVGYIEAEENSIMGSMRDSTLEILEELMADKSKPKPKPKPMPEMEPGMPTRDEMKALLEMADEQGIQPFRGTYNESKPIADKLDDLLQCVSEKDSVRDLYQCYNDLNPSQVMQNLLNLQVRVTENLGMEVPDASATVMPSIPYPMTSTSQMIDMLFDMGSGSEEAGTPVSPVGTN